MVNLLNNDRWAAQPDAVQETVNVSGQPNQELMARMNAETRRQQEAQVQKTRDIWRNKKISELEQAVSQGDFAASQETLRLQSMSNEDIDKAMADEAYLASQPQLSQQQFDPRTDAQKRRQTKSAARVQREAKNINNGLRVLGYSNMSDHEAAMNPDKVAELYKDAETNTVLGTGTMLLGGGAMGWLRKTAPYVYHAINGTLTATSAYDMYKNGPSVLNTAGLLGGALEYNPLLYKGIINTYRGTRFTHEFNKALNSADFNLARSSEIDPPSITFAPNTPNTTNLPEFTPYGVRFNTSKFSNYTPLSFNGNTPTKTLWYNALSPKYQPVRLSPRSIQTSTQPTTPLQILEEAPQVVQETRVVQPTTSIVREATPDELPATTARVPISDELPPSPEEINNVVDFNNTENVVATPTPNQTSTVIETPTIITSTRELPAFSETGIGTNWGEVLGVDPMFNAQIDFGLQRPRPTVQQVKDALGENSTLFFGPKRNATIFIQHYTPPYALNADGSTVMPKLDLPYKVPTVHLNMLPIDGGKLNRSDQLWAIKSLKNLSEGAKGVDLTSTPNIAPTVSKFVSDLKAATNLSDQDKYTLLKMFLANPEQFYTPHFNMGDYSPFSWYNNAIRSMRPGYFTEPSSTTYVGELNDFGDLLESPIKALYNQNPSQLGRPSNSINFITGLYKSDPALLQEWIRINLPKFYELQRDKTQVPFPVSTIKKKGGKLIRKINNEKD